MKLFSKLAKIKTISWRVLLVDVFLVIAAFLLANRLIEIVDSLQYDLRLSMGESSFYSWMEDENYANVVLYTAENRSEKRIGYNTDEMRECYAVGDYYEAASLYKAYLVTGDEARAAQMLEQMQEAEAAMGELSIEIPKIRRQLGLEE